MVPKDVHILIPRTCESYLTWQREIKVADQLVLKWEMILSYPEGLNGITVAHDSERGSK